MKTIAERLKKAREDAGYATAAEASEALGWKYPTYAGHENAARGVRVEALQKYAKAFRVSLDYLLTGKNADTGRASEVVVRGESFLPVPVYDVRASAGAGALVEDGEPSTFQVFQDKHLRRLSKASVDKLAVIQVSGDSMAGTLDDGDHVLVDRSVNRIVQPGIYVLLLEGELIVKRCERELATGALLVISDNKNYSQQRISPDVTVLFDVIGRVIWIGRSLVSLHR